ncbi:HlyD family efflux transporter periplasmic adaptor subunit [Fulvivirgaceae bacterium BMA10]|uniref:HlyD family efflux transporter periplasmic adaptor subunit n=1 Tax=Splendidivirga corallicola TaxID=3051826 RepID=A0ABT8KHG5_9BACT|nr:HlyD family efflux transporter periplasmic adaptor subunit [Fulvivirgaceae bacterium BMA10]
MDRVIKKKKWTTKRILGLSGGTVLLSFIVYSLIFADNRSKLNVDANKITISTISEGDFQEWIPETGTVQPIQTFYLDAIEGGIIQELNTETGSMVKKGDPLVTLTNSNLQLDVLNREAQLYEQINNLRTSRLLLDQNTQNLEAQLAEINYQLELLGPQYKRQKILLKEKAISQQEFEAIEEQYEYNVRRKEITYESYKRDSVLKRIQIRQLNDSETRMWKSLEAVGNILGNLIVKAPRDGQFASPQLEIGQSIGTGERLGQIDIIDDFKLRVAIDELYLPRIAVGQIATYETQAREKFRLEVTKVYPTITQGNFEVDMEFDGGAPKGIKRGQSLRIRIELGNPGQAILLPSGGFFQSTGGNWIFVLDESEGKAVKQSIRVGRKNSENYEVLEGLNPGDKVITSSYDNFGDNEVLLLNY